MWVHNLVNLHYSDDQTDYPVAFQLWKLADLERLESGPQAAGIELRPDKFALKSENEKKWRQYLLGVRRRHQEKPAVANLYQSKLMIACQLLSSWVADHPGLKLPVTFDNWYTQPAFCQFIDKELRLPYVGTLAGHEQVILASGPEPLSDFARRLKREHLEALKVGGKAVFHQISITYKGEEETYYSYCCTHRVHNFGKQRLVINHRQPDLSDEGVFYILNRLYW